MLSSARERSGYISSDPPIILSPWLRWPRHQKNFPDFMLVRFDVTRMIFWHRKFSPFLPRSNQLELTAARRSKVVGIIGYTLRYVSDFRLRDQSIIDADMKNFNLIWCQKFTAVMPDHHFANQKTHRNLSMPVSVVGAASLTFSKATGRFWYAST